MWQRSTGTGLNPGTAASRTEASVNRGACTNHYSTLHPYDQAFYVSHLKSLITDTFSAKLWICKTEFMLHYNISVWAVKTKAITLNAVLIFAYQSYSKTTIFSYHVSTFELPVLSCVSKPLSRVSVFAVEALLYVLIEEGLCNIFTFWCKRTADKVK